MFSTESERDFVCMILFVCGCGSVFEVKKKEERTLTFLVFS